MKISISLMLASTCLLSHAMHAMEALEDPFTKTFIQRVRIVDSRKGKISADNYYIDGELVPSYSEVLLTESQYGKLKQSISHVIATDPQTMQRYITLDIARIEDPTNPMLNPKPVPTNTISIAAPTLTQTIFNPTTLTVGAVCALTAYLATKHSQLTNN